MMKSTFRRGQSVDHEARAPDVEALDEEETDTIGDITGWEENGHVLFRKPPDHCGNEACLIDGFPESVSIEGSLRLQSAGVLAIYINKTISLSGIYSIPVILSYISELEQRPLNLLMTLLGRFRPRFLPLEYHWAPTEKDPYLCLVEAISRLDVFIYIPHPLGSSQMESVLSVHFRLSVLSLKDGADDSLLRIIGNVCRSLVYLDVSGSKAVTDCGLRRLLLRPPAASRFHWRQLYRRWRELRSAIHSPSASVSYHPIFMSAPSSPALETSSQKTQIASTLQHLDLRGTKSSVNGAEWAAKRLEKGSHVLFLTPIPKATRRFKSLSNEGSRQSLLGDT